jgi:hypothetical protein
MSAPNHDEEKLERLGGEVARALGSEPLGSPRARARFLAAVADRGRRSSRQLSAARVPRALALGVGAVLAVAAALFLFLRTEPQGFVVGQASPGTVGTWVGAVDEEVPLRFDSGASLLLRPGARCRVDELEPRSARVRIERGAVVVAVPHGVGMDWHVEVGPYDVHVTGTSFETAWDAAAESFTLEMREGAVEVRGPGIDGARHVITGERIELGLAEPDAAREVDEAAREASGVSTEASGVSTEASPVSTEARVSSPSSERTARSQARPRPDEETPRPSEASWRELVRAGRYDDAIAAVRETGVERALAGASAEEVLSLGDAARYGREPELARRVYETAATQFAGQRVAADAHFELARLAAARGAHGDAASEFARALSEVEPPPREREALGRLLEALDRSGDREGARRRAADYLARFPEGPHAGLARSLEAR